MLQKQRELEKTQLKQGDGGGHMKPGTGAHGLVLLPVSGCDILKPESQAPKVYNVPGVHLGAAASHLHAVDPNAASGVNVVYLPLSPVVSGKYRMTAADSGIAQSLRRELSPLPMRFSQWVRV